MPRDPFAIPTEADPMKKAMRDAGVPYAGPEKRKNPRISVDDLNQYGVDGVGITPADLTPPDDRNPIVKVLDILDVPRNLVANGIADLTDMPTDNLEKGTFGLPKVYMSDVLRHLGVLDPQAEGFSRLAGEALGLAGDVIIDPWTYATLGASTGLSIGEGVPKVLRSGTELLDEAATAIAHGGEIPEEVARAWGGEEKLRAAVAPVIEGLTPEAAKAALWSKKGGALGQQLAANALDPELADFARPFLAAHGEKGRTLFRLPFAESGITSPWGSRARIWKEAAGEAPTPTMDLVKDAAAGIAGEAGKIGKLGKVATKAQESIDTLTARAADAGKEYEGYLKGYNAARRTGQVSGGLPDLMGEYPAAQEAAKAAKSDFAAKAEAAGIRPLPAAAKQGAEPSVGRFVPSSEWQEVPKGVAIPPGAEIRMELGGKNFARWEVGKVPTEVTEYAIPAVTKVTIGAAKLKVGDVIDAGKAAALTAREAEATGDAARLSPQAGAMMRGAAAERIGSTAAAKAAEPVAQAGQAAGQYQTLNRAARVLGKTDLPGIRRLPVQTSELRGAKRRLDVLEGVLTQAKAKTGAAGEAGQLSRDIAATGTPTAARAAAEAQTAAEQASAYPTGSLRSLTGRVAEMKGKVAEATAAAPRVTQYPEALQQLRTPAKLAEVEMRGKVPGLRATIGEAESGIKAAQLTQAELAAKAQAAKLAPNADEMFKAAAAEKIGSTAAKDLSLVGTLRRMKRAIFGAPDSELGRYKAGGKQAMGPGARIADNQATARFTEQAAPILKDVAATTGKTPEELKSLLYNLIESRLPTTHILDPVRQSAAEAEKLFAGKADAFIADVVKTTVESAAESGSKELPGYLAHVKTPEFAKNLKLDELQQGARSFNPERTLLNEYTDTATGKVTRALDTSTDAIPLDNLVKQGLATKQQFHISAELWNQLAQKTAPAEFKNAAGEFLGARQLRTDFTGDRFLKDVPASMGQLAADTSRAVGANDFATRAAAEGVHLQPGQVAGRGDMAHLIDITDYAEHTPLGKTPFWNQTKDIFKGKSFPQPVVDMVEDIARISRQPEEVKGILRASDVFLHYWKPIALMSPARNIRDFVCNIVSRVGEGIDPIGCFQEGMRTRTVQHASALGNDLSGLTVAIRGRTLPADVVVRQARQLNIFNSGLISSMIEPGIWAQSKNMLKRFGQKWFAVGNEIQNWDRFGTWIHLQNQGYTAEAAALKTIRALPDMSDMTMLGDQVGKRIWPFWTWMSKNGANVLRRVVEKPALLGGTEKIRRLVEQSATGGNMVEPTLRPDWMQGAQAMQIAGDKNAGTMFLAGSWMGFSEILSLFSAATDFPAFCHDLLSKIRPDAKFMIEAGAGTDIFKHRPVEPFTTPEMFGDIPMALAGRSGTPLDNLLSLRPVREVTRMGEMPTVAAAAARPFIGGALQPITRQGALGYRYSQLKDQMQKTRSALNRAIASNDEAGKAALTKEWFNLQAEFDRLGLPGVAKRTKTTLRRLGVTEGAPAFVG